MLAIFCYVRQQEMLDALSQALIGATRKIELKAEVKLNQDILFEVVRVGGKFDILYKLAYLGVLPG